MVKNKGDGRAQIQQKVDSEEYVFPLHIEPI